MSHKHIVIIAIVVELIFWLGVMACQAEEFTNTQIVNAIYKAEGGAKAQYPYGIRSIKCETKSDCRRICLNTVKNNRKRYEQYGRDRGYKTYLEFLASRYCPTKGILSRAEKNLNKNWLKNVKFFLKNP